jgi:hypothetical protein
LHKFLLRHRQYHSVSGVPEAAVLGPETILVMQSIWGGIDWQSLGNMTDVIFSDPREAKSMSQLQTRSKGISQNAESKQRLSQASF